MDKELNSGQKASIGGSTTAGIEIEVWLSVNPNI